VGARGGAPVLFLAAHGILAKYLYGHPPAGVPAGAGRAGAELMYYGGDLIDLALIVVFCWQWYRATDPGRRSATVVPRIGTVRRLRRPWRLPGEFRTADGGAGAGS
jgi:putative membrane protein